MGCKEGTVAKSGQANYFYYPCSSFAESSYKNVAVSTWKHPPPLLDPTPTSQEEQSLQCHNKQSNTVCSLILRSPIRTIIHPQQQGGCN